MRARLACVPSLVVAVGLAGAATADVVEYDAASGMLPESLGWSYSDNATPAAIVAVADGVLSLTSTVDNRARWDLTPVPNTSGDDGAFMEVTVQVVSEQHTQQGRGAGLPQVAHADGAVASGVDLYAWEDRIFLNDYDDETVGTHFMNTTDAPHAYRVELLRDRYWVFVDDALVLQGVTPTDASSFNGVSGGFGDPTAFSGSVTQWTSVRIGSLADIGGPTVPEPGSVVLVAVGATFLGRRRFNRLRYGDVQS